MRGLKPPGVSASELARKLHVPRTRIERLANEQTGVTSDTALRFAKFLRMDSPEFWVSLQANY